MDNGTPQAGILWKNLNCKFTRRAPLITACIFLHNWRVDRSLSRNYRDFYEHVRPTPGGGLEVMVSPGQIDDEGYVVRPEVWLKPPQVDRKGRLVELLSLDPDWASDDPSSATAGAGLYPAPSQRQHLEDAIRMAGVERPVQSSTRRRRRLLEHFEDGDSDNGDGIGGGDESMEAFVARHGIHESDDDDDDAFAAEGQSVDGTDGPAGTNN